MAAKSRYARMHKVSHTKPLHDATAQMTDEAVTHRPQTTTIAMDAKPTKHTQTLTLRKARCDSADAKQAHTDVVVTKGERDGAKQGVVRFWKEWCSNPSGSRPNSFGRQHLTFDKGRAWMPEVERPEF